MGNKKIKICTECGREFLKVANAQKHCKQCAKELEKKHIKNWTKNNKKRLAKYFREYNLKNRYNLTLEQWQQMFEEQQGCCAICGKHQNELSAILCVDHNHLTGKVRALLCNGCNQAVGYVEKDYFDRIMAYLEKHN